MSDTDDRPSIAEMRTDAHALEVGAPVLLEIAAAALELREQEQVAAKARHRVYAALHRKVDPSDEEYRAIDDQDRRLAACRSRYLDALAKVRP